MLGLAHSQPRLRHKVAEGLRLSQSLRLPQQTGLHLFLHHRQRRVVSHQLVEKYHHQPAQVPLVVPDAGPQKRGSPHIHTVPTGIKTFIEPARHVMPSRILFQFHFLYLQRRLPPYHLHRLPQTFPHHPRAQGIMPLDHPLQGLNITV